MYPTQRLHVPTFSLFPVDPKNLHPPLSLFQIWMLPIKMIQPFRTNKIILQEPLPRSNYDHYLYFIGLVIAAEIIIIIVKLIIHFYVI